IEVPMPRMMEDRSRLVFSYSGLKTHMINLLRKHGEGWIQEYLPEICAAFQSEALGQLVRKLAIATSVHQDAKTLLIAGGVSANQEFRRMLEANVQIPVIFPGRKY